MISTDDFDKFVEAAITKAVAGAKAASEAACIVVRLRAMTIAGELVYADGAMVSQQISDTEPLAPSVVVTEEAPSTQVQEDSDTLTANTSHGGDKISGERTTTEEE